MSLWNRLRHEPLAHFLVLGALLFVLNAVIGGPDRDSVDRVVRVTDGDVNRLAAAWQLQWRRPPTAEELSRLVDDHVREEILYREAIALGLDQDDSIIRRRLAQKMQFLSEDLAEEEQPDDDELKAYFEANAERFAEPARVSFSHLYFSPDQRGAAAGPDAREALKQLLEGASSAGLGDRFMLQSRYTKLDEREIAGLFGNEFAADVFQLEHGSWAGPVTSGYGLHLVLVEDRTDQTAAQWPDVRGRVLADWSDEQRRTANDRAYERLRQDYEVVVDAELPAGSGMARALEAE